MASQHLVVVLAAQGGAILGVAWPLSSGLASGPLRILRLRDSVPPTHGQSSHE